MAELRQLFPPFEPFDEGFLPVDDGHHRLFYEQSGNPEGKPVVVLHGGPGGGCSPKYRQFFDPKIWRVVMFDQRGSGKSEPFACLKNNTTRFLVQDIETLRNHLGIDKWVVFGGSWGSTLALTYAETHPDRVKALVLRGIFMLRRSELIWFYQEGASNIFPDAWEKYLEPIPVVERHDMMSAYYRRLTGDNEEEKLRCARAWTYWEMATSCLIVNPEKLASAEDDKFSVAFARIESHYFVNGGFFDDDAEILNRADQLKNIPGSIAQGRYDLVCPIRSAWDLHKKWPQSELHIIADAGHSCFEPGIQDALLRSVEKYTDL